MDNINNNIKYFQGKMDCNTIYIFIDESGNLHEKTFKNIQNDIARNGLVSNDNKCYTLTALVINSIKKYKYLAKGMKDIKMKFFPKQNIKNLALHRTNLRETTFMENHKLTRENVYFLEKEINSLIIKHKLPTFSVSLNNEVLFDNPKYKFDPTKNLKDVVLIKLLKNIQKNIKKKNPKQRVVIVIETTNEKNDKRIVKLINELIKNKTLDFFKSILITKKISKNLKPILGNELVDFICYSYFLWASNSLYHNSKFLLYGYPNHYKNSLSLIDAFY